MSCSTLDTKKPIQVLTPSMFPLEGGGCLNRQLEDFLILPSHNIL